MFCDDRWGDERIKHLKRVREGVAISVNDLMVGTDWGVPVGPVGVFLLFPRRVRRLVMMPASSVALLVGPEPDAGVPVDYTIQSDNHSLVETPPPTLALTASLQSTMLH